MTQLTAEQIEKGYEALDRESPFTIESILGPTRARQVVRSILAAALAAKEDPSRE